jgi:hypothetical protein
MKILILGGADINAQAPEKFANDGYSAVNEAIQAILASISAIQSKRNFKNRQTAIHYLMLKDVKLKIILLLIARPQATSYLATVPQEIRDHILAECLALAVSLQAHFPAPEYNTLPETSKELPPADAITVRPRP